MATWGRLEHDKGNRVAEILSPLFPGVKAAYLRTPSPRPAHIGALAELGGKYCLLSFRIYRGAIRSDLLADELANSVNISIARLDKFEGPMDDET